MTLNPYEPPQTIDPPPEPPTVQQTHLEQVSFRHLSEITWGYAVVGQILLAACMVAMMFAGVTWAFYVPDKNPNWVIAVMLGCGSILAVLVGWAWFTGMASSGKLGRQLNQSIMPTKRERGQIALGLMGVVYGVPITLIELQRPPYGLYFLLLPVSSFALAIWPITRQQAKLLNFLRSFHSGMVGKPSSNDLLLLCFIGAILAASCLVAFVFHSASGSMAWGWLLPAVMGSMVYIAPITLAYRQLAREFDKLWP